MRKPSCYAYRETINGDKSLSYDCKFLTKMLCDRDRNCPFFKTSEQYNARKVEADVARYGEGKKE